ncbi:MAG: Clp protease ClpP [Sporichthyaceae bacterium]|nr:Clp protease ClpP [Sporichthyaceae bacterium]
MPRSQRPRHPRLSARRPVSGARLKALRARARTRAGSKDWYRIANSADGDSAEVYIYDEIGYWGTTAADFIDQLRELDVARIDLHLNTPGGEVFDGVAIYNALVDHQAEVTVYVDALAASIGSVIAMSGDRVVMGRSSQLMIHDAWGMAIGNAADMREMADLLDKISDSVASVYVDRAGGKLSDWRDLMLAETWFTGDEAVEAGLADEVKTKRNAASDEDAEPDEDEGDPDEDDPETPGEEPDEPEEPAPDEDEEPDPNARWDLSVFRYAGRDRAPAPNVPLRPAAGHLPDLAAVIQAAVKESRT